MIYQVQQCAFSRAGRPDHRNHITRFYGAVHIFERSNIIKALSEMLYDKQLLARGKRVLFFPSVTFFSGDTGIYSFQLFAAGTGIQPVSCKFKQPDKYIRQQEIYQRRGYEREERVIGTASDDVRDLGELKHGDIPRNGGELHHRDELTAVHGDNVRQRLWQHYLNKAVNGSKTKSFCGARLSRRNSLDTASEYLRGIRREIQRKADHADKQRGHRVTCEHYVIQHHKQNKYRYALNGFDIYPRECCRGGITAHSQTADDRSEYRSDNAGQERKGKRGE